MITAKKWKGAPALVTAMFALTLCSVGVPSVVSTAATAASRTAAAQTEEHEAPMFQWEHPEYAQEQIRQIMGTCLFFAAILTVSLFKKSKDRP